MSTSVPKELTNAKEIRYYIHYFCFLIDKIILIHAF